MHMVFLWAFFLKLSQFTNYRMATANTDKNDPPADEIVYGKDLSIRLASLCTGENASLKNYFGLLVRSDRVIDVKHKYCKECLSQEKITR